MVSLRYILKFIMHLSALKALSELAGSFSFFEAQNWSGQNWTTQTASNGPGTISDEVRAM